MLSFGVGYCTTLLQQKTNTMGTGLERVTKGVSVKMGSVLLQQPTSNISVAYVHKGLYVTHAAYPLRIGSIG